MRRCDIQSLLCMAALWLPLAPAAAARSGDAGIQTRSVIVRADAPAAAKEQHVFEIRVEDGQVSITADGKKIQADRLRIEDGRLVVLDQNGNEIKSLNLFVAKPGHEELGALAREELERAKEAEQAHPPVMLGIQMSDPGEALRRQLHLEPGQAAMVSALYEGLAAQKAGLDQYDIIVAVNGKRPAGAKDIREALAAKAAGDEVKLTVIHEGQTVERTVKLEAYDAGRMQSAHVIGETVQVTPGAEGGMGWPTGQDWRAFLVDPRSQQWFRMLGESDVAQELREQLRQHLPQDLDARLERLNQRVDEIKKMIDSLIEQARELAKESKQEAKPGR